MGICLMGPRKCDTFLSKYNIIPCLPSNNWRLTQGEWTRSLPFRIGLFLHPIVVLDHMDLVNLFTRNQQFCGVPLVFS